MEDFLLRFATCSNPQVASTCTFTVVREGLIVALLSIGTLVGALLGAPYVPSAILAFYFPLAAVARASHTC